MIAALVLLNLLALAWALAPIWQTTPLERRARTLRRHAPGHARPHWRDQAQALAEAVAIRAPAALRQRAAAMADAAGWAALAAARLIAASLVLPLAALMLGGSALIAALLAGAPWIYARNAALRRKAALQRGLPEALDLLVICAESGLPLDAALARTGRELAPARPAIAAELSTTAVELGFLPRRADAFANLAQRVPLPAVAALGETLVQTERFGTPLAPALQVMAEESRATRLLGAEARAARLPALMTVPMIMFVLPPLFVILIGPAIIEAVSS
jgi:tight adherence protein C